MKTNEIKTKLKELGIEQTKNKAQIPPQFEHYYAVWRRNQWIGLEIVRLEDMLDRR